MIITDIKRDKKHLFKVSFDDLSYIMLDADTLSDTGLKTGDLIDENRLKELKYDSDYKRAKSRALWYLDRMDYTEKALFEKLQKAGFGKKVSAAVLEKFCELGLVDDLRYAERFAQRCQENNISKRESVHKMLQKGIPLQLARQVTEELETDEEAQILALIERKYKAKLSEENGFQKVFASLGRKGFDFGSIKSALKKYNDQLEFSED